MPNYLTEGHRGFCSDYPENTLESFEAAIDLGVDGVEFDIWLTKDKEPIIMHDESAYRTTGVDRSVKDMTLQEIKQLDAGSKFNSAFAGCQVPTLSELLDLVARKRPSLLLGVEIKDFTEETVDITVSRLKEKGFFEQSMFYCFNARIIQYLRTRYHAKVLGYPDFAMKEFVPGSYAYYTDIGISMAVLKSEVFPLMAAKNLPMHMYCADTLEDIALCEKMGAVAITSNNVRVMMSAVNKK